MADAGIHRMGAGGARARRGATLEVFNESIEYWAGCSRTAKSRTSRSSSSPPTGATWPGSRSCAAAPDQMNALRFDEFSARTARADLIVENQGVVDASLGEGLGRGIGIYQQEIDDLD